MASVRHLGLFPFCVGMYPPKTLVNNGTNVFATGAGTLYSLQLGKQEACALWWRVKEWRVTFTFSEYFDLQLFEDQYTGSFVEVLPITITLTTSGVFGKGFPSTGQFSFEGDETGLVCLNESESAASGFSWDWQAQRVGQITYPPDPITGIQPPPTPINYTQNYTASLFTNVTQQLGFPPAFVYADGQNSETRNPDLWAAFALQVDQFYSERQYANNALTAPVKLLEKTVGQLSLGTQFDEASIGYTPTLSNVVVEPHEYWPYDPGDGLGPIYDSTTGAQLRAFPST